MMRRSELALRTGYDGQHQVHMWTFDKTRDNTKTTCVVLATSKLIGSKHNFDGACFLVLIRQ